MLAKVGDVNTVIPFERVSSCNTTLAAANFAQKINESVLEATTLFWGEGEGVVIDFAMMQCDNARQLVTRFLKGLMKEGMVDSQQVYHDLTMHSILRHKGRLQECLTKGKSRDLVGKQSADRTYRLIKKHSACLFKVYGNHTRKAMRDGYNTMKNKPQELLKYGEQVN